MNREKRVGKRKREMEGEEKRGRSGMESKGKLIAGSAARGKMRK